MDFAEFKKQLSLVADVEGNFEDGALWAYNTLTATKPKKVDIEKKQKAFYDSLRPFLEVYGPDTLRAFYNYWSEPNKSRTKIKWELEETWDTKRRLDRWVQSSRQQFNSFNKTEDSRPKYRKV